MSTLNRQMPGTMDWFGRNVMVPNQKRDEAPRNPEGSLYRPGTGGQVRGDHPKRVKPVSLYNRAERHPLLSSLVMLGVAGAALALLSGGRSRR